MPRLLCYMYREGEDFFLPPALDAISRDKLEPSEGVLVRPDGQRIPDPEHFEEVEPEKAKLFLFPYDLGPFINLLGIDACAAFLKELPYLGGRERRHVFCDDGDIVDCIPLPVCLLKRSLLNSWGVPERDRPFIVGPPADDSPRCIVTWYSLSDHVAADDPSFLWDRLRYDCSFVGAFTHVYRKAACASLEKQKGIRFYNGGFEHMEVRGKLFFRKETPPEEQAEREARFRRISKDSLTILCPPGVGPQSVRMYETMYFGRIPLLFTRKIRYPLEHAVDYDLFCFFIDEQAIMNSGAVLRGLLDRYPIEELRERCILACKTWNRFFSQTRRHASMAGLMAAFLEERIS